MTDQLSPGQTAPAFSLPDASGTTRALEDYRGRKLVVYFYPKAATPGCTTEACDFRDSLSSLRGAGYDVVGISPDAPEKLTDFATEHSLSFPLLADQDNSVARAWGAWGNKTVNGVEMEGILRSTFVVDESGKLTLAQYSVTATGHVSQLRTALGVD